MKNIIVMIVFLCLILSNSVMSQVGVYPYLWKVLVKARVEVKIIGAEKMFYYSYTLVNPDTNIGMVEGFEVDVSRGLSTIEIDTVGLRFRNDGYTERIARRKLNQTYFSRVIPVGFLQTPAGDWLVAYTNALTVDFSVVDEYILPGKAANGFLMMSKGLPGIRACIVSPYFDVDTLFPNPAEDTTITGEFVDSIREAVKYRGWTIGPTALPNEFVLLKWYEILMDYTNRSLNLGWIKDKQTGDKYRGYFTTAEQELERNNISRARTILQNVLRDVDKDSTATLTSEAYALIRYNTEYLIGKFSAEAEPVILELIDSLIQYRHQCGINGWLTGEEFVTELDNYLIEGRYLLSGGDSIGYACNVKRFQQAVEAEYRDTLDRTPAKVTVEGWKFLYYNAQYILDRLPAIPAEPLIKRQV